TGRSWRSSTPASGATASASSTTWSPIARATPIGSIAPSGRPASAPGHRPVEPSRIAAPMALSPRSQQALLSLPAFRGLGEAERKQVAERVRGIALEKGEIGYRAGDDADALYLVVAGAGRGTDGGPVGGRRPRSR